MPSEKVFTDSADSLKTLIHGRLTTGAVTPVGIEAGGSLYASVADIGPDINSMWERLQVAETSPLFYIQSLYGISSYRDITAVTGAGTVTNVGGPYVLSTTAAGGDSATLRSALRGRISLSTAFDAGIVARLTAAPAGNQKAAWGYTDGTDGAYFGQDATGVFIAIMRSGIETTKVYQQNWNADRLDGTGASGLTLSTTQYGHPYHVRFGQNWGIIEYRIMLVDSSNILRDIICHRQAASVAQALLANADLPIWAYVENGGTAAPLTLNVHGRYFDNLGPINPLLRSTGDRRLSQTVGNSALVPTVAFRPKAIFPAGSGRINSVRVFVDSFDIVTNNDLVWELRFGSTLNAGATWGVPTNNSETACESCVNATTIDVTTGNKVLSGLASAGQRTGLTSIPVDIDIPEGGTVTLAVMGIAAPSSSVSVDLRVREEW